MIGKYEIDHLIARAMRLDNYDFFAFRTTTGEILIRAGCRTMLIGDYYDHIKKYPDTVKIEETKTILDYLKTQASRGRKSYDEY